MILAMINVALARATLEEDRNRKQLLSFLNGAEQTCCGSLADIPLAVQILVVALSGRNEMRIDFELIAFDTDFTVDKRLAAGMIGQAQSNARCSGHDEVLSEIAKICSKR